MKTGAYVALAIIGAPWVAIAVLVVAQAVRHIRDCWCRVADDQHAMGYDPAEPPTVDLGDALRGGRHGCYRGPTCWCHDVPTDGTVLAIEVADAAPVWLHGGAR